MTFAQVVEAVEELTADQKEALAELLRKRSIDARRRQIVREVRAAQREHRSGKAKPVTVDRLMREIRQ